MSDLFIAALEENNLDGLITCPKSDLHNHASRGCKRSWLSNKLSQQLMEPPISFEGIDEMQKWYDTTIKPFCKGKEGSLLRWEGCFAEAQRNNIVRLSISFSTSDIDCMGGMTTFMSIINSFHKKYCPNTIFEPELTYAAFCNVQNEVAKMDEYLSPGYFRSIDVCCGEGIQPIEAFIPLYRKAETYNLVKRIHVGETGSAEEVKRAVELLGLDEIHHGINASSSSSVMKLLADRNIQLNICPSSNVMLKNVQDYKTHPIKILVENGVPVTINTDDLLIFDSSVENEYLKLYNARTLSAKQLDEIRLWGIQKKTLEG